MDSTGVFLHEEPGNLNTLTPQKRAEYYGAKNYNVGENIIKVHYRKSYKPFNTFEYEGIADAIVDGWVDSKGHFENMIRCAYQVTGVSVQLNLDSNLIYACQKFASINSATTFVENTNFFPTTFNIETVDGFGDKPSELEPNFIYPFKLRHDKPEKCELCESLLNKRPIIGLIPKKNNQKITLRIENSEFVEQLLNKSFDGFALEVVEFNDYLCGNPTYYSAPSRRKGDRKLNGKTTKPKYKRELESGFKKRKKNKDIRFVDYIFKSDSLNFFEKFGAYNKDKYSSEYFEIDFDLQKNVSGILEYNLVYIQNKQICHIDYFPRYCFDVTTEYLETKPIFFPADGEYDFVIETEQIEDVIEFKKNEFTFSEKDLVQFINQKNGWQIDSIQIVAFSSVEGDSVKNYELQQRRAQSIADIIGKSQNNNVKTRISSKTDWEEFYNAIKTNPKWSHLTKKSHAELIEFFNKNGTAEFEKILSKQRRGIVTVYYSKPCNQENMVYYIKKETNKLRAEVNSKLVKDEKIDPEVFAPFTKIYTYAHRQVLEKQIDASVLASIKMPDQYTKCQELAQKYVLYGLEFKDAFGKNEEWHKTHEKVLSTLLNEKDQLNDQFKYLKAMKEVERNVKKESEKKSNTKDSAYRFDEIVKLLNEMRPTYINDTITRTQIDRLNVNANYMLLYYTLKSDPKANSETAIQSISQLYEYYKQNNGLNAEKLISLSKTAIYYFNNDYGLKMLEQVKSENDSIHAFYMSVKYTHIEERGSQPYYNELLYMNKTMDRSIWCNMFINQCGIPFQAFDYEPLRKVFCEQCLDINRSIIDIHKKDRIHNP
jgi:hypothetical protein